jgi:hypothetical protein
MVPYCTCRDNSLLTTEPTGGRVLALTALTYILSLSAAYSTSVVCKHAINKGHSSLTPLLPAQVRSLQRSVTSLQQTNQAQHRQILVSPAALLNSTTTTTVNQRLKPVHQLVICDKHNICLSPLHKACWEHPWLLALALAGPLLVPAC